MSLQFTYQTTAQETYVQQVLQPRAYVLSSNTENLILQSPLPEARLSLITSTASSNSSNIDRYIISASNNQLSILNNSVALNNLHPTSIATFQQNANGVPQVGIGTNKFNGNALLQVAGDATFTGSVNITNLVTACNIGVSNLSLTGGINTQNNNINVGSGTINVSLINSSNINTNAITTSSFTINSVGGPGTFVAGAITATTITTQNNSVNIGSGTLRVGIISSGIINTQNNAINIGSGGLRVGSISSGIITTQDNYINIGTGTLYAGIISSGPISSGIITTQNNLINLGTGSFHTDGIVSTGVINTQNNLINAGTGSLSVGSISSGIINTQNSDINIGSGSLTVNGTLSSGIINTQNNLINTGSGSITTSSINTQNNSINSGSGTIIAGTVGIGTTNPQSNLDVWGTVGITIGGQKQLSITSNVINFGFDTLSIPYISTTTTTTSNIVSSNITLYSGLTATTITTQNNTINTGSGGVTFGSINTQGASIIVGSITAGSITTQNNTLNTGSGTLNVGIISSGIINTQNSLINAGTGSLNVGPISSGIINTQNNLINIGSGSLTLTGAISSGIINTQNNNINAGSGTVSASNLNLLPGGSISYNKQIFIDSNQNITTRTINTQNNLINIGSGTLFVNSISPQTLTGYAGLCNSINFNSANLMNIGVMGFSAISTPSINSVTNQISFNNTDVLNVNSLVVNSNITILANGINTFTNLPSNVVTLNLQTGQILDSIISSNIVRIMQSGQYAGTINPAQLPIVPSNRSTLLRTSDSIGIGTRVPAQKLHVNAGNQCITGGRLGIGTTAPFSSLHIYDNNASAGAVVFVQADGSTDYMQINASNAYALFKIASSCNIGIRNNAPMYTLDVNGTTNTTTLRTNYITTSAGTINCTNTSLSNINEAYIRNLTVTSNFNVPANITATNIKTTDTTYTNVLQSASNANILVKSALNVIGFDTSLYPGSGYPVGNIDNTYITYIGVKVDYAVYARNLVTPSDRRIKGNIKPASTSSNLNTLLRIPVRNYTLIADKNKPTQGFIAQELETILPHAVSTIRNVIPNIMRYAELIPWKPSSIYLIDHGLHENDTIKVYINNKIHDLQVRAVEPNIISFNDIVLPENAKIYVYGKFVDDFKVIEHEKLFPVICSATQELHSIITNQQKTINTILQRLALLETTLSTKNK